MDNYDINQAIELLKQGYIIYSFDKLGKIVLNIKDNLILIKNNNALIKLNIDEFINLYKSNKFYINDIDSNNIDLEKDKEYYSFRHK